jgi:hypothetical protein
MGAQSMVRGVDPGKPFTACLNYIRRKWQGDERRLLSRSRQYLWNILFHEFDSSGMLSLYSKVYPFDIP